jgi:ubiquinone/menaquinone biosynthesis C-methylase UbiE
MIAPVSVALSNDVSAVETFVPLLTNTDWNEEWKELQKIRQHSDKAAFWDKRADTFGAKDAPSPYVHEFLSLAKLRPEDSVFDMGCGTGSLALPLGAAGHEVIAADFSSGMLGVLQNELVARDIHTVRAMQMSWEDDWEKQGITDESVDVCFASRSIAVTDLKEALLKLTCVARRRVCITLATGASPRVDERILSELGVKHTLGCDYLYAFNILAQLGYKPEISYIKSERADTFENFEAARENLAKMIKDSARYVPEKECAAALDKLDVWLKDNLIQINDDEKPYRLRHPRVITWAFISWDK